jgi:hypothetical protein
MTALKYSEAPVPGPSPEAATPQKLPSSVRKLLAATPEKDWPRLRVFLTESEEAGELLDLLPEMNRVMRTCPARIMGRVGRREITADQLDQAYTQLHDSMHGVRQALQAILHLAGFEDVRPPGEGGPMGKAGASDPDSLAGPPAPRPKQALTI